MAGGQPTAATRRRRKRLTREDKRQANRARILQAARKVFGRSGYYGATIEEIGDEAGLSNGAVYYNFQSKEDLFLTLLDDWRAELIRNVESAFSGAQATGAPEEQLQDEVRQVLRALGPSREWQLLLLEFVTYAARNPGFRRRFVSGRAEFKSALANALEQRVAELGLELALPAEQLTLLVVAIVNGLAVDQLTEPGAVPGELVGRAVAALVEHA
jgi:AcrR family transcriptional regulator